MLLSKGRQQGSMLALEMAGEVQKPSPLKRRNSWQGKDAEADEATSPRQLQLGHFSASMPSFVALAQSNSSTAAAKTGAHGRADGRSVSAASTPSASPAPRKSNGAPLNVTNLASAASRYVQLSMHQCKLLANFEELVNSFLTIVSQETLEEIRKGAAMPEAVVALVDAATAVGARVERDMLTVAALEVRARERVGEVFDRPSIVASAALLCLALCSFYVGDLRHANLYVSQAHTGCLTLPVMPLPMELAIEHLSHASAPVSQRPGACWWHDGRLRALHASSVAMSALALAPPGAGTLPGPGPRGGAVTLFDDRRLAVLGACASELLECAGSFGPDEVGTLICGAIGSLLLLALGRVADSERMLAPAAALVAARPNIARGLPVAWTATVATAGLCCVHDQRGAHEMLYEALSSDAGAAEAEAATAAGLGACGLPLPGTSRTQYLFHRCSGKSICYFVVQAAARASALRAHAAAAAASVAAAAATAASERRSGGGSSTGSSVGSLPASPVAPPPTMAAAAARRPRAASPLEVPDFPMPMLDSRSAALPQWISGGGGNAGGGGGRTGFMADQGFRGRDPLVGSRGSGDSGYSNGKHSNGEAEEHMQHSNRAAGRGIYEGGYEMEGGAAPLYELEAQDDALWEQDLLFNGIDSPAESPGNIAAALADGGMSDIGDGGGVTGSVDGGGSSGGHAAYAASDIQGGSVAKRGGAVAESSESVAAGAGVNSWGGSGMDVEVAAAPLAPQELAPQEVAALAAAHRRASGTGTPVTSFAV